MANSNYEYVKDFEAHPTLLKSTYIVVRIDGRSFHRFSKKYEFAKPNDKRASDLMNAAATAVMGEFSDVGLAYGVSDEFSFVFDPSCELFERRESKIITTVVSTFTAYFVYLWPVYFPSLPLSPPLPSFDGRAVCYPREEIVKDYMRWRQVDCHINNLYNTTFWAMVQKGGMRTTEAEAELKGTLSADKNEILFSRFGINYNKEEDMFKKGSVIYRSYGDGEEQWAGVSFQGNGRKDNDHIASPSKTQKEKERKRRAKATIVIEHVDIIKDGFWQARPWLLGRKPS